MKTFSFILTGLLLISFLAEGQYKVVNYTNVNKINHLLEDGDFIWVSTSGGVYKRRKSSGAVVMHYNTLNSGLKKDAVSLMYKDNFNNYWFAYHGGLSRFDGTNWTFYPMLDVPGHYIYYVFAITSDLLGNLLFATERGVVKYNGQEWILIKDQSPETYVQSVVVDDYNNIWFTSRLSDYPLCKIDNEGTLRTYTPPDYNSDHYIHTMEKDPDGKLWLSTWQKGLMTFDPAQEEWVDYSKEINLQYVTSITPDNSGNMWFGSSGVVSNGVCRYNLTTGSKDYYSGLTYGEFDQCVNSVLCDVSGNIWIGSWNGLARVDFSTGTWTMPLRLNCLPSEKINCTGVDSKGNAYMFGQVGSMIELKDNTYWNTYNAFGGYPWYMLIDENDIKWAPCMSNTYSIMLNKFDSENNRTIYILSEDFSSYFNIYGSVKDKYNGLIWIGSEKGLTWFNPDDLSYGTFTTLNSDIPGNFITGIAADTAAVYFNPNGPWGKYDIESGVFSELSFGEGFPEYTYISDLEIDKEGNKWILTDSHIVKMSGTAIEYWNKPPLSVY